jgi:hypothetical protein
MLMLLAVALEIKDGTHLHKNTAVLLQHRSVSKLLWDVVIEGHPNRVIRT